MLIRVFPSLSSISNSIRYRTFTTTSINHLYLSYRSMDVSTKVTSHNQYHSKGLDFNHLSPSPIKLFDSWFQNAIHSKVSEPEAMCISTSSLQRNPQNNQIISSKPSSRMVLLKKLDDKGFLFYTNYDSRKGKEIEENPYASATIYWRELHQSIRIVGRIQKVRKEESEEYFKSRPLGSRVGARASPQSQVVKSRKELEDRVKEEERQWKVEGAAGLEGKEKKYENDQDLVPLPENWGGYRIIPEEIEFWVGRENRLHDRFRYTRDPDSTKDANQDEWKIDRLGP